MHSRRNFEDDVLLSPKAPLERSRTSGRSLFRQQGAVPQSPKSVRMKRRPSMDEARLSPSVFAVLVKLVRKPHLRYLKYQPAQTNLGTKSVAEGGEGWEMQKRQPFGPFLQSCLHPVHSALLAR